MMDKSGKHKNITIRPGRSYGRAKTATCIAALLVAMLFACQGCSHTVPVITTPVQDILTIDSNGVTGAGISIGSTYVEWARAYSGYQVQVMKDDTFVPYSFPKDIAEAVEADDETVTSEPSAEYDGTYMVSAFYINDEPVSVDKLVSSTGVAAEELADHLSSPEYLKDHKVLYRYTVFTITDGLISDIKADYLDYNTEL